MNDFFPNINMCLTSNASSDYLVSVRLITKHYSNLYNLFRTLLHTYRLVSCDWYIIYYSKGI